MDCSQLQKWLDQHRTRIAERLVEFININTTTPHEEECFPFLQEYIEELDFHWRKEPLHPSLSTHYAYARHDLSCIDADRANLRVELKNPPFAKETILFSAHVDVVPGSADFPNSFAARIVDHHVIGRGACDNKNNIVMLLEALRFIRENDITLQKNIKIDFVIEEEIGGAGALSTLLYGVEADAVICLEPTELQVYRGHRGCVGVDIEITGRPGHMGGGERSISAIDCAIEVIQLLKGLEAKWNRKAVDDPDFSIWERCVQVNVGKIRGGEWHGSVPEKCVVSCNVGFLPPYSLDKAIEMVAEEIRSQCGEWLRDHFSIRRNGLLNDAYIIPEDSKVVSDLIAAINSAGVAQTRSVGWKVSCDARLYKQIGSRSVVIFGCGNLSQAHSNHESVAIAQLFKGIEILVRYLSS